MFNPMIIAVTMDSGNFPSGCILWVLGLLQNGSVQRDENKGKTCDTILQLKSQVLCFQLIELIAIWPILSLTAKSRKNKVT